MPYVISKNCVCCHNCAMECPMGAINYVGMKYEIDQAECVECGLCEKLCHTCSISEVGTSVTPSPHAPVIKECDVLVCGGGTGIITAVKAAQSGKKVILIEKSKKLGGNTDYAHAFFPVYTKWHQAAGMPDVREEAVAHYRKITDNVLEEDTIRAAVYGCGEFFDWLCTFGTAEEVYHLVNLGDADAHGPIYGPGLLDFPNRIKDNLLCRDDAIGPGWGGTYVKYTMLEAIRTQKLHVEILTETAAKHLITDPTGTVTGVIAHDPGGEVRIHAKAVVLATGGMGKSDEKLAKYFDFFNCQTPIHRFSVPTDTGDGIDMLQELGVEPDSQRMFCSIFGPKHHPFNNVLADIALQPEMLHVNAEGRRWVDESLPLHDMTPLIAKQPKEISWSIATRAQIQDIAARYMSNPAFASKSYLYETWESDLEEESKLDIPVKKADSLAQLAILCNVDSDTFLATIQQYNALCCAGADGRFGKSSQFLMPIDMTHGPYYAIYGQRFSEGAFGGLRVNGSCEVLRENGTSIPGLYGVGDATSAMHRKDKLAVISELTWATASAYLAALNAVAYLDGVTQQKGGN